MVPSETLSRALKNALLRVSAKPGEAGFPENRRRGGASVAVFFGKVMIKQWNHLPERDWKKHKELDFPRPIGYTCGTRDGRTQRAAVDAPQPSAGPPIREGEE